MPDEREDVAFHDWLAAVDRLVIARFGIGLHDLPDLMTRHAFDNGLTAEQFFKGDVIALVRDEFGEEILRDGQDA